MGLAVKWRTFLKQTGPQTGPEVAWFVPGCLTVRVLTGFEIKEERGRILVIPVAPQLLVRFHI